MTFTPNHRALSREHLAEAHALAGAGESDRARDRLVAAADHALRALAASGAARDEHVAVAVAGGATPALSRPGDAVVSADELDAGFEHVQRLIDAALAEPAVPAPPSLPMYGGAAGATRARGAEAAARALAGLWAALRR
jgi:hypothetical protein